MTLLAPDDAPPLSDRFANTAIYDADPRSDKVLLQTGLYIDPRGQCPPSAAAVEAERRLLEHPISPAYGPTLGHEGYRSRVQALILGSGAEAETIQTLGGTGAIRLAGELIAALQPDARVWVPSLTWPNHLRILGYAGLTCETYPWDTKGQTAVDAHAIGQHLRAHARAGDVLLLHAACHNPTGIDLTAEDWRDLTTVAQELGLIPLLDVAFLGYCDTPERELAPARQMASSVPLALWTISLGKTLRLYSHRVGALIVQGRSAKELSGHAAHRVRALWSSPPVTTARLVHLLLEEEGYRAQWHDHLSRLRDRLRDIRRRYVQTMVSEGVDRDLSHVLREVGLFTQTGLTPEQTVAMRREHAIYLGTSGGINVSPLGGDRLARFCRAAAPFLRLGRGHH